MSEVQSEQVWPLAAALVVLVGIAAGVGGWARLGLVRAVLTASARALVQLLAVGLVIGAVFRTQVLAQVYVTVMLAAAAGTSGRRLRRAPGAVPVAALAIGAGAAASGGAVLICGALAFEARTAVPFVAQLIGGSMTAATLAGQRLLDDVTTGWDEVEGWLALGASPAQALRDPARRAPHERWSRRWTRPATSGSWCCPARSSGCCSVGPPRWRRVGSSCWCWSACSPHRRWRR